MVVGSYASTFHGEPRMTRDIEIVVDPSESSLEVLVDLVDRDRFYLGDAMEALRDRGMFNLIERHSGWKVDFVIKKDRPFSDAEFERRIPARVNGVDVEIATVEDTILAKLEWSAASRSDRQLSDVIAMAAIQELDRVYLEQWAKELGIGAALAKALNSADQLRDSSDS